MFGPPFEQAKKARRADGAASMSNQLLETNRDCCATLHQLECLTVLVMSWTSEDLLAKHPLRPLSAPETIPLRSHVKAINNTVLEVPKQPKASRAPPPTWSRIRQVRARLILPLMSSCRSACNKTGR